MQSFDDIKLFTWYTFSEGENRSYGHTLILPLAKRLSQNIFIGLLAVSVTQNDAEQPTKYKFETIFLEPDEILTEYYPSKGNYNKRDEGVVQAIFSCKIPDNIQSILSA